MHQALAGEILTKTDFRVPQHATVDLSGLRVEDVVARGKHILIRIGPDVTLHTHFKMEGEWHLYKPGARWRVPAWQVRVVLVTEPRMAVGSRLAVVELVERDRETDIVGHLGPDLLGPDWDPALALANMSACPEAPIGETLLDQRMIAGLGNVYKSEICFLAGIDPWTPTGRVADLGRVIALAKRLMEANRSTGMQITTGIDVKGRRRWVYGRGQEPCRRCGTPIERSAEPGERVTYWCPGCQPARAAPQGADLAPESG